MSKAYHACIIEYEAGWGSKVDGYLVAKDKETFNLAVEEIEKGDNYELFWRVDEPKLGYLKPDFEFSERGWDWIYSGKAHWLAEE